MSDRRWVRTERPPNAAGGTMRNISWKWIGITIAMAACVAPEASAGPVEYKWGPMAGSGTWSANGIGPFVPYQSFDGYLIIDYDPNNSANDVVSAFIGDPVNLGFG